MTRLQLVERTGRREDFLSLFLSFGQGEGGAGSGGLVVEGEGGGVRGGGKGLSAMKSD